MYQIVLKCFSSSIYIYIYIYIGNISDLSVDCMQKTFYSRAHSAYMQAFFGDSSLITRTILSFIGVSCNQYIGFLIVYGYLLYARYLCSRDADTIRPSARATIGYLVYKAILTYQLLSETTIKMQK